ncbi:MAG TPA: alanyl-tRNA editing protein [Candidatus Limnocylindria bacterium]|nr:alanyl-tRNA editing protein [Candidatus Limnocylindria bacterium]
MTQRLYFDDARLARFMARVTGAREENGTAWLSLDRSAFYPEGGGQPGDTGTLRAGGAAWDVADVQADAAGEVWHLVRGGPLPAPGTEVAGVVDWERRLDHMQQHTGEHILANCVWRLLGGFTHGLHIGHEVSSIDVTLPDGRTSLSRGELDALEEMAAARVAGDAEVDCRFLEGEELAAAALRKEPTVTQNVRVCRIGDFEAVACGGTHLARASQVGQVVVLHAQPARGKTRLFFLCGKRAEAHGRMCRRALAEAGALLSARADEVPGRVRALLEASAQAAREVSALRRERALERVPALYMAGMPMPGGRLVAARLSEAEAPYLQDVAGALAAVPGVLALLCAPQGEKELCLFARSPDRGEDVRALLHAAGAVGGGRPDFARGAAEGPGALERAAQAARGEAPGR